MSSIWYTAQITPTGGSPVNYYFTTPTIGADPRPITGMYLNPYNGNNILYPEPGTTPSFNSGTGAISGLGFVSSELQTAYFEAVPSQVTGDNFTLSGVTSAYTVKNFGSPDRSQSVVVSDTTLSWYTLSIAPTGGISPVNYYFSTVAGNGFQPITGIFNNPYASDDISTITPNPLNIFPVYNPDSTPPPSYIRALFTSTKLQLAYANASPSISTSADFIIARPDTPSNNYYLVGYYDPETNNYVIIQQGGVTIVGANDPSCFNEGTQILCLNKELKDEYVKIEELRKGDLVKCYKGGYRRIDMIGKGSMINNRDNWKSCMYKMSKTEENGLIEDLIVTGGHSILVDELGEYKEGNEEGFGCKSAIMIDDKYLLLASVSPSFEKVEDSNVYTYYHFVVENDGDDSKSYGVWGNGVLTESMSKEYFKSHMIC